jgi:hypothetical protein
MMVHMHSNDSHEAETKPRWCRPKLVVDVIAPKPNPLFTPEHTALVKFLRYSGEKVKCAHCGRRKSILWTMLCSFKVADMKKNSFVLKREPTVYPPLTGVCQTHMMAAEMEEVDEQGNKVEAAEKESA